MIGRLRRRFFRRLLLALGKGHGAHRIALAFAVGIAIGLSPFFGLHLILSLVVAVLLRLDKLDVVLGTLVLNPFTVVPIYSSATAVGALLLGTGDGGLASLPWDEMHRLAFWREHGLAAFGPYLEAFVLGSAIFAAAGGFASYWIIRRSIEAIARRRARRRSTARPTRST